MELAATVFWASGFICGKHETKIGYIACCDVAIIGLRVGAGKREKIFCKKVVKSSFKFNCFDWQGLFLLPEYVDNLHVIQVLIPRHL